MKNNGLRQIFSFSMIIAILATIFACAFTPNSSGDPQTASTDQELPFEESEKEFEDKDEADEKDGVEFELHYICDVRVWQKDLNIGKSKLPFSNLSNKTPLFLSHHSLLI